MTSLTDAEREALQASGSWPNVGRDLFAAVESILAARLAAHEAREARVRALASEWELNIGAMLDLGDTHDAVIAGTQQAVLDRLRAVLAGDGA